MVEQLESLLSDRRLARLDRILGRRIRHITLVLEDLYDPLNCAACLRTAEAFGLQDVHIIEGDNRFEPSKRVTQGCHKWLHIHRHGDPTACLEDLRKRGYRIAASSLDAKEKLADLDIEQPLALAFGAEHPGLSRVLLDGADLRFRIPMRGFSQSLNVSVAVAVTVAHLVDRHVDRFGDAGDLSDRDKVVIRREWVLKSVKQAKRVEAALESRTKACKVAGCQRPDAVPDSATD